MKQKIKHFLSRNGYKISKINEHKLLNENPLLAIKDRIPASPTLFDIGANQGQTIDKMIAVYPHSKLYSFEPSRTSFKILMSKFGKTKNIVLNNVAVGADEGSLTFNEYSWSHLSSLLKRSFTKSEIVEQYLVDVVSIDMYCQVNNIDKINLLKTDTEGYELSVLHGASTMMDKNKIQFVYLEIFFFENYIGQSSFGDIYNYLLEKQFKMIRFYDVEYTKDGFASRTDALFLNENFKE